MSAGVTRSARAAVAAQHAVACGTVAQILPGDMPRGEGIWVVLHRTEIAGGMVTAYARKAAQRAAVSDTAAADATVPDATASDTAAADATVPDATASDTAMPDAS